MWVYVLAIGAALCFGVGSVVQQRAASQAPPQDTLRLALLWWLVHQPLWVLGVGFSLVGNLLSASALSRGSIALIEPLYVSRLLFALPLAAAWMQRTVPRRDWGGALATGAGLAIFVVAGNPHEGHPSNGSQLGWIVTGGVIMGLATGLMVVARRSHPMRAAPLLAIGAGLLFSLQAALMGTATHVLSTQGLVAMLTWWYPYGVLVTAIYGSVLLQSAFEMAPLPASFPALVTIEPMTGIAIGVGVLGGSIRLAALPLGIGIAGLAVMTFGIYLLATSPLVTGELDRLERRHEEGLAYRTEDELAEDLARLQRDLDRFRVHLTDPALASKDAAQVARDQARVDAEIDRLCALFDDIERHRRAELAKIDRISSEAARREACAHDEELDAMQQDLQGHAEDLRERADALRRRADELRNRAEAGSLGRR